MTQWVQLGLLDCSWLRSFDRTRAVLSNVRNMSFFPHDGQILLASVRKPETVVADYFNYGIPV